MESAVRPVEVARSLVASKDGTPAWRRWSRPGSSPWASNRSISAASLSGARPGSIETTWTPLEVVEERLVEAVIERHERREATAPAPGRGHAPLWPASSAREAPAVRGALLAAADAIACQEPPVAADLLRGLSGTEIEQRRLVLAAPGLIAHGLAGLHGDGAMALHHRAQGDRSARRRPQPARAGGRGGLGPAARVARTAPREVARSLEGLRGPKVAELREALAEQAPSEVAASLAGDDGEQAWTLRERIGEPAGPEALAWSLSRLDC